MHYERPKNELSEDQERRATDHVARWVLMAVPITPDYYQYNGGQSYSADNTQA